VDKDHNRWVELICLPALHRALKELWDHTEHFGDGLIVSHITVNLLKGLSDHMTTCLRC
jgi:hypothetical protein